MDQPPDVVRFSLTQRSRDDGEAFDQAGQRGVEEAFSQSSSVNGEVSGPYILDSCPRDWNRWSILVSGLIVICVLAGVLAFVYKHKLKAAPT
jgi:hypothetical protein